MRSIGRLNSRKLAWVSLCSLLLVFSALSCFAQPSPGLSPKERLKAFEQVWRLINEKYYDPGMNGVDWNAVRERYRPRVETARDNDEFYQLLKAMTGELHDAHTRFRSPGERRRADRWEATTAGISIGQVEGEPTVVSVDPDSEAARAGVEPGMTVIAVDGVPFRERLDKAREEVGRSSSDRASLLLSYHNVLTGEPNTPIELDLATSEGKNLHVKLNRHITGIAPPVVPKMLPSGFAYISLRVFNERVARQFKEALEKVRDAPGLVVDLRGNGGGELPGVLHVADGFFGEKVSFGRVIGRYGKKPSFILRMLGVPSELEVGSPGSQIYSGPVVILVNDASGSGAELFSAGMKETGRAAVVGRQTCGCVLASIGHKVTGGGAVGISEFNILTGKGARLEGAGLVPDVVVPLTLQDLRGHRDASLRQAVGILTSSVAAAQSSVPQ